MAAVRLPQPRRHRVPRARPRLRQVHQPQTGSTGFRRSGSRCVWFPRSSRPSSTSSRARSASSTSVEELHESLKGALGAPGRSRCSTRRLRNIPYVSMVDGGTIDLVRSLGFEVVSSAGLVQTFEAVLDEAAFQTHLEAGEPGPEDQGRGVRADRQRAAERADAHPVRRAAVHHQAVRRGGARPTWASTRSSGPTSSRPIRTSSRPRETPARSSVATPC